MSGTVLTQLDLDAAERLVADLRALNAALVKLRRVRAGQGSRSGTQLAEIMPPLGKQAPKMPKMTVAEIERELRSVGLPPLLRRDPGPEDWAMMTNGPLE